MPVVTANISSDAHGTEPAAQARVRPSLCRGLVPCAAYHYPLAYILGDRQRMVQVALICMGIAILILTRGNRF